LVKKSLESTVPTNPISTEDSLLSENTKPSTLERCRAFLIMLRTHLKSIEGLCQTLKNHKKKKEKKKGNLNAIS